MILKKILLFLLLFTIFSVFFINCSQREQREKENINKIISGNKTILKKIIELNNQYTISKNANILLAIGDLASKMKISIEDFNKNGDYKKICHLRIVRSENFGDFVSYDGYHYNKIINDHPKSELVDDATYNLIYITPEEYNYTDLNEEKNKLELFLKKYPNSNLKDEASKRYNWLVDYLNKGNQAIVD